MHAKVRKIIQDIRQLKIQGARNVARKALEALVLQVKYSKAKTKDELYSELLEVADALASTRPTEPMTQNELRDMVRFALMQINTHPAINVKLLKKAIITEAEEYEKEWLECREKIAQHGARLIQDGMEVLTYCHSSTVMSVLKQAYDDGTKFHVTCFETRPLFQGHITAKELATHGIDVRLVVDGAMNHYMKHADLVIVGADAITAMGDLINKIGTSTLAHIARAHDVSFYSAAELFKYDPLTLYGKRVTIEKRDVQEVWKDAPAYINIENYAFDATAARYINGFITEIGIVPPQALWSVASQKLGINLL